jgi:phosphoglycerate dehydrogenase-like enzyme
MSDHPKVVCSFIFSEVLLQELREAAGGDIINVTSKEDFLPALREAEVLCGSRVPENWREAAPNLRWVQFPGAGVDSLRKTRLLQPDSGILVTTASGIHITSISEYVFASMLMFNRSWPEMVHLQDRHIWPRSGAEYHLREKELADRTLGIVGMGHIGRRIAQVAHAFGMRVLATRLSARAGEHDPDAEQVFGFEQLHDLLSQSDYVVIAVPLTDKTEKLIGEAELRAMKPDAYLVNIARGRVIDELVLIRALREGWIGGAGLDVASQEPLPADNPLYDAPNVILTPHISGANERYAERLAALFADNLRRYRTGQPLRNLYDPQREY